MLTSGLFISLDGRVDADDTWQYPYFEEELYRAITAGNDSVEALLVGRHSFEGYDRLRSEHPDSPALPLLNSVPKHVVSTTLRDPEWPDTHVIDRDVASRIAELKADRQVLLLGSPSIVRFTLEHGLLDEMRILILPIVVGRGPRLFADLEAPIGLAISSLTTLGSGVINVVYRRV